MRLRTKLTGTISISKAEADTSGVKMFERAIKVWQWGNSYGWKYPKLLRVGFSGSLAEPYTSLHLYIWKIDVCFWRNPLRPIMDWVQELKLDMEMKRSKYRCNECGSHRLRIGRGFAYEPNCYCKDCGTIKWEADPEPYIR